MKSRIVTLVLAGLLLPLSAWAQDDEPEPKVEKKGVIVIEEDDGDGETKRKVIILGGDHLDLDGALDGLPEEMRKRLEKRLGGLKMRLKGGKGFDFDFDFDFSEEFDFDLGKKGLPFGKDFDPKRLKEMMGDPKKRAAWLKDMRKRVEAQKAKRERDELLKALKLGEDDAKVVVPLLEAVLETRDRIAKDKVARRTALKKQLTTLKDETRIRDTLAALRAAERKDAEALKTVREKLREVITLRQELHLVGRDILN